MGDRGREPSPPVLVLGASFGIALPVARCLGARGIGVDMATSTRHQPRVRSRAVRSFERLPDSRAEPVAFRRRLLELCRAEDYGLLIPAGDSALAAVRRNFQSLRELVPVGCPEPRKLEAVLDKGRTLDLASSLDVPVPATCTVEAGDGLGHVVQALDFPVVVKPRDKYGESSLKVEHFRSPAGLEDWFRTWQQSPGAARELHVQEFVPGHGVLVLALTAAGTPMTPVLQQVRLKEYPPSGGLTVRGRIERPSAPFDGWALRLFRELEWTGPVAAEFRHDPDAGRVVLLELNGRYWASLDLTLRAGVDLPFYHWRMSRGEKIEAAPR